MMKTSPNRGRSNTSRRLGIFFICLVLLAGIVVLFRAPLSQGAWDIALPFRLVSAGIAQATGALGAQFTPKASLEAQNQQLKIELASSTAALADRSLLLQENTMLKSRLGQSVSDESVIAAVLMRPPATPYDDLIIDAGSRQGVAQGDMVASAGDTLIGEVTSVSASTARISLFSTAGATYNAILQTQDGNATPLSMIGQGMGSLTANVPAGTAVVSGDSAFIPSINANFIAKVVAVKSAPDQSFETLYFQEPVNPFSLSYVEVLTSFHAQS